MLLRAGHIEELKMNLDSITTLQEIERFYRKKKKRFPYPLPEKEFHRHKKNDVSIWIPMHVQKRQEREEIRTFQIKCQK
jgi:hypothetical protein